MSNYSGGNGKLPSFSVIVALPLVVAMAVLTFPAKAELIVRTGANSDQTKPQIDSGPTVISVSDRNAVIRWTTDEVADSRVSYQSDGQILQAGTISEWVTEHFVVLSKLSPGIQYSLSVQSQDAAGNLSEPSQPTSFATLSTPDATAPAMQGLPEVGTVTATSVAVNWTTDEVSRGRLEFGSDSDHLNRIADQGGYYSTQHTVTLMGLTVGQTYHYRVVSTDPTGKIGKSDTYSVKTSTDPGTGEPPPGPTKASQTIEFDTIADQVLATKHLTLSASSSSGLPVSFSATTAAVCTVNGNTLTLVRAGTCTVEARQSGNADYQPAPSQSQSFVVLARMPQTIELTNPGDQVFGTAFLQVEPIASSGLRVTLRSSSPNVCVPKSGYQIRLKSAGICSIAALQSGNRKYSPADPVTVSFAVSKATQTIGFDPATPVTKALGSRSFLVRAKASSHMKVTFRSSDAAVCTVTSVGRVKVLAAGSCKVIASQPGNRNYLPAQEATHDISVQ